ncbi:acetolactate decarboxylase [Acetobacter cibinongensis]|uniref:Alpha-acetolactate decarboxylase n=1 Tax=Acetobacter cibinongensis TaxID=146475 RepID=A0A1Z5YWS6_9PROT|nr:acetolactate decarboxylase [Acetobacter cibinongensis]OUJ03661.1 alpha-acetolactate decarboxylase [Acetobacter cibinongensis]
MKVPMVRSVQTGLRQNTQGAPAHGEGKNKQKPVANRLYQTSTMAVLLDAVYDGETTLDELLQHGNFGLGTFNALDGEMIVTDGVARQFRAEGVAAEVPGSLKTPFACVTYFEPEQTVSIDEPLDKAAFEALVDRLVGNSNLFAALRFTGLCEKVDTRTVFCQCHPYPPMLEVVKKQPTLTLNAVQGTMIGFRTPAYMQGINVAGYHVHFLTEDQKRGGHVTEYKVTRGTLEVATISDVDIRLPRTQQFAKANLSPDHLHQAIQEAEGG